MADSFVEHVTIEGERWDTIANKAYGDPYATAPIIAANRSVPVTRRLPGGITIYIPVLSNSNSVVLNSNVLPPWK